MAAKIGTGDVSFRLGAATPSKVYLGSTQVWSAASVPGAPTGLIGSVNAYVSFDAPADDGGAAITSYRVYADSVDVTDSGVFIDPGIHADIDFQPNFTGEYFWQVSAVNSAGEGPKSTAYQYTIV